jgi:hypothetical protein
MGELAALVEILNAGATPGIAVLAYLLWRLDRRLIEVETLIKSVFQPPTRSDR